MKPNFGLGKLLELSGGTKNEFDGTKGRGFLPVDVFARYDLEDGKTRAAFNHWHSVQFKAYVDQTRLGLSAASVSNMIDNGVRYLLNGVSIRADADGTMVQMVPARDPMTWTGEDLFICREAYTGDFLNDMPEIKEGFSVRCWAGTEAEIASQIAFENAGAIEDHRETLSLQLYNLSKAVRFVLDRARLADTLKKSAKAE